MIYELSKNVTVLGKAIIKPERSFSFLSYLVRGEKNILVDTVPQRSAESFLEAIKSCIPIKKLDALILNHSEEDHSGAVGRLLEECPALAVYCSPACHERLAEQYPDANLCWVRDRASIAIGSLRFQFFHTPGLHWEDNMVTYFENEKILFSNDLFGQAMGAEPPIDSSCNQNVVLAGAKQYFETVFSAATTEQKNVIFPILSLDISFVAPGHGVVLSEYWENVREFYEQV